jgi:GDP-L-fucose synthase
MHKKVLITGKMGQLGRELFNASNVQPFSHNYSFIFIGREQLDLTNSSKTKDFIGKLMPDFIIHTAAKVGGIQFNINNTYSMLYDNLIIDLNVINAALEIKTKNLIYFSSSCMYPIGGEQPFTVDSIFKGSFEITNENYAIAKATITKLMSGIDSREDVNYKTYILSNLYGKYDNFNDGQSHVLASALKKVYSATKFNSPEVVIWGSGTPRREFTRASDVAEFTLKSLSNLPNLPSSLNLGTSIDYSILEIYEIVKELLNYNGKFYFDDSKPDGVYSKLMNSEHAKNLFDWKPQSDLYEGIDSLLSELKLKLNGVV